MIHNDLMVNVSKIWAPGSYQWGGVLYPPYKIRLNVVNALIFAPEHHIIKRKLFWSFGNDWTWWRHRDVTFLQQTFENDVIWRHVTSWHHHHIKLGRNVSLIDISLLSKYEVIWSIIDKVMAIYVSISLEIPLLAYIDQKIRNWSEHPCKWL